MSKRQEQTSKRAEMHNIGRKGQLRRMQITMYGRSEPRMKQTEEKLSNKIEK
jgi:hypothetical protein